MIENLDQLVQYLRQTLPYPRSIINLQVKDKIGAVTFYWQGVEFLVKPSLHVLEVRGHSLYITGLSTLLQTVLMKGDQNEKLLENALQSINDAEDLIRVKNQTQAGLQLLGSVRDTLGKLAGR